MIINKDILFTILCCVVFLMASGKTQASIWSAKRNCPTLFIFNNNDSFPEFFGHKHKHNLFLVNDSTSIDLYFIQGPCKENQLLYQKYNIVPVLDSEKRIAEPSYAAVNTEVNQNNHKKLHGDLMYDFSSHNSPDTTYPGSAFTQNYVVANLYTTLNNKYPVVFHFGTLQTTVPYIRNNIDISLQFDKQQYNSDMADHYRKQYQDKISQTEREDSNIYKTVLSDFKTSQALQNWLVNDKQIQELMRSSQVVNSYAGSGANYRNSSNLEQNAIGGVSSKDSNISVSMHQLDSIKSLIQSPSISQGLSRDSSKANMDSSVYTSSQLAKAIKFIKTYQEKLRDFRKLVRDRDSLEKKYDSLNSSLKTGKDSLDQLLKGEMKDVGKNFPDSSGKKRADSWIMGIRQLGIGRSFINYSELSAKNLSLFGINAEYCDHYYFALAAGKTDFRYQDFLTSTAVPKQYLFLGRFGIGEKEGRHLYFTVYTGSKQASYYVNNQPTTTKLTGITLEAKLPLSKNIDLTGEVAKSTAPSYILSNTNPAKISSFNDRNNEAYSLQMNGYFPKSDTRILALYNRYGIYFQSFNIYNNNATSSSWKLRLDQYLFKKKLLFSGFIQQNDFSNPFIVNNYKSKTLIYSLQTTLRIRKWPTLTIGYLPFSQLSILQGQITENRFYTLLGSSNYAYRFKKLYMISSVVYTQYFNSSNQLGFIYYNAQSWFFNQSVMLNHLTVSGAATISHSAGYQVFSVGPSVQWTVLSSLSIGGGVKYNVLNDVVQNLGYNANMDLQIKQIGKIGVSFEKGFIPSQTNQFFRNNWGRATYSKLF